jgi:hypothetical protein
MAEMLPPWMTDPDFGSGKWSSLGDDQYGAYFEWLQRLDPAALAEYEERYPPPEGWSAFYPVFSGALLRQLEDRHVDSFDSEGYMLPPWIACPDIPRYSIGWRMGGGEDYWIAFIDWYRGLQSKEREQYRQAYPEPDEWSGLYDEFG